MRASIKVAVIGTGALGKEHARIYHELATKGQVEFVGVFDANADTAAKVAGSLKVVHFESLDSACAQADAFSLVTPTVTHFDLARTLLNRGKHVLVEKPMTCTALEAAQLIQLAQEKRCILQVGHVERFNPVFRYLETHLELPRFIEAHRLSPFPARSTDIGVVLDLMIHDLDVILAFVKSPVAQVDAVGIPVLSATEDIANARLRFANGCIANLTASRVSPERLRKIRVFSGGRLTCYVSLDYRAQQGFLYRLAREEEPESPLWKKILASKDRTIVSEFHGRRIVREPVPIEPEEPLKLELQSFLQCVSGQLTPVVSGESAKRALDLALDITRQIQEQPGFAQAARDGLSSSPLPSGAP
jgi:predicted dehydrogenase